MKKILLFIVSVLFCASSAFAEDCDIDWENISDSQRVDIKEKVMWASAPAFGNEYTPKFKEIVQEVKNDSDFKATWNQKINTPLQREHYLEANGNGMTCPENKTLAECAKSNQKGQSILEGQRDFYAEQIAEDLLTQFIVYETQKTPESQRSHYNFLMQCKAKAILPNVSISTTPDIVEEKPSQDTQKPSDSADNADELISISGHVSFPQSDTWILDVVDMDNRDIKGETDATSEYHLSGVKKTDKIGFFIGEHEVFSDTAGNLNNKEVPIRDPNLNNWGEERAKKLEQAKVENNQTTNPPESQTAQLVTEGQFLDAALNGKIDIVRKYLNQPSVDVNAKNNKGSTTLMLAAYNGHKDIVELLLENHADINAKNNEDSTALMLAAYNGHKDIVELLLEHGADINATDNTGWTALMYAAFYGHKDIVELLLEHGADITIKGGGFLDGTALDEAKRKGHTEIVKLLQAAKCAKDRKNQGLSGELQACCYFDVSYATRKGNKCVCMKDKNTPDPDKIFRKISDSLNPKEAWACQAESQPVDKSEKDLTGGSGTEAAVTTGTAKTSWNCAPEDIALINKWLNEYGDNDQIIYRSGELLSYCEKPTRNAAEFRPMWDALYALTEKVKTDKVNAVREASHARIKESTSRLDNWIDDFKANTTVWKNEKGKFNATRLLSDTAAAVVLGTTGGLVTSKVMKKNQIKKGFENVHCTVGGQIVANWGDEFQVGVHQNN